MVGLVKLIIERDYGAPDIKDDLRVIHTPPDLEEQIVDWYTSRGWEVTREMI